MWSIKALQGRIPSAIFTYFAEFVPRFTIRLALLGISLQVTQCFYDSTRRYSVDYRYLFHAAVKINFSHTALK